MEIIRTNIDVSNKKAVYRLTKAASVRVQDLEQGLSLPVESYMLYTEENSKGEKQNVLTVVSGGTKLSTISQTFIRSFFECVDLMGEDPFSIIITGGQSKNGRRYVDCELDCD